MNYRRKTRDEHLAADVQPKRILALDGGGLRGIVSVAFLQQIETLLRKRHGGNGSFRLSDYFDLVAGTSTGAIIAAAVALGWKVDDIRRKYFELGESVFEASFLRQGLLRAKYDERKLTRELKHIFGTSTTIGSSKLKTGLLVVAKRLDTGSPWPISNNPRGKYFPTDDSGTIGNAEYPLWQVVRASTAAPTYFDPEYITIKDVDGHKAVRGQFVDGGASPFNNPALQAVMYASLDGYRLGWPMGEEKILLVSVGTGRGDPDVKRARIAAKHGLGALVSLMDDSAALQETMLQWMSTSPTARPIDRELGTLDGNLLAPSPLLTYLRYDLDLRPEALQVLDPSLKDAKVMASLTEMDAPENMPLLHELAKASASRDVDETQFPLTFDLPSTGKP